MVRKDEGDGGPPATAGLRASVMVPVVINVPPPGAACRM